MLLKLPFMIAASILFSSLGAAQSSASSSNDLADPADTPIVSPAPSSSILLGPGPQSKGVQWGALFRQSLEFLTLEGGFRYLREDGARHSHLPFVAGYVDSVTNLHGWADGDPFYVNYVGHPIKGAVAGFIWIQNDPRYWNVEIGRNREYWKSRLRAAAFSFAYSASTEIGPISEASIGATQAYFPEQGFVDYVVTPSIGLVWLITEDVMDKYVVELIERHTSNPYLKLAFRGGLNPGRSLANAFAGRLPWARLNRPGVFIQHGPLILPETKSKDQRREIYPKIAPFEFVASVNAGQDFSHAGPCVGGGGEAAVRLRDTIQLVMQFEGCKMSGLQENRSGDSLSFLAGPRWTPLPGGRWSPFIQLLAGGRKLTQEDFYPKKKAALAQLYAEEGKKLDYPDHTLYTSQTEAFGFELKAGIGVDMKMTNALALRVASLDYTHSWTGPINGVRLNEGLQVTSGLVLRMGTW
jgi:hypothetical protein